MWRGSALLLFLALTAMADTDSHRSLATTGELPVSPGVAARSLLATAPAPLRLPLDASPLQGISTYYGGAVEGMNPNSPSYGTLDGSCGYGLLDKHAWPYWSVGAPAVGDANGIYAGPSFGCGRCFKIACSTRNGPDKCKDTPSTIIQLTDSCPECKKKANITFDIQANVFAKIMYPRWGILEIDYRPVPCQPPGNIVLLVWNNYGGGAWIKIAPYNVAGIGEVAAMSISQDDVNWHPMTHTYGGVYETGQAPGTGPWSFLIKAADGHMTLCSQVLKAKQTGKVPTKCQIGQYAIGENPVLLERQKSPAAKKATKRATRKATKKATKKATRKATRASTKKATKKATGKKTAAARKVVKSHAAKRTAKKAAVPAGCKDVAPDKNSCAKQRLWGKCSAGFMVKRSAALPHGYCAVTCSRCHWPGPKAAHKAAAQTKKRAATKKAVTKRKTTAKRRKTTRAHAAAKVVAKAKAVVAAAVGRASGGACSNVPPSSKYTCKQQASWGKCKLEFMTKKSSKLPIGFCAKSCGRC